MPRYRIEIYDEHTADSMQEGTARDYTTASCVEAVLQYRHDMHAQDAVLKLQFLTPIEPAMQAQGLNSYVAK